MPDPKKEATIPTEEEIAQLPRWAIVAFAARCARRVEPIFTLGWPKASKKHKKSVSSAIVFAEKAATDARTKPGIIYGPFAAYAAYAANDAALNVPNNAAADAAFAAHYASQTADCDNKPSDVIKAAVRAAGYAANAIKIVDFISPQLYKIAIIVDMRTDFNKLMQAAKSQKWTNETPVPPKFFGHLWPIFEPNWEIVAKEIKIAKRIKREIEGDRNKNDRSEQGLSIQVIVPDSVPAEQTVEELVGLIHALSEYHIACGGNGLTIEDFQTLVEASVPVGVGL